MEVACDEGDGYTGAGLYEEPDGSDGLEFMYDDRFWKNVILEK